MSGWRTDVLDIRELIHRLRLGQTARQVAAGMSLGRNTVAKYRDWACQQGFLGEGPLPDPAKIQQALPKEPLGPTPGPGSTVAPLHAVVEPLAARGVEARAIFQILRDHHGYAGHYSAVKRYVRRLRAVAPEAFVRVETPPGQEAQVDFGFAGRVRDSRSGQVRKCWVFVMTLSHSRHPYARLVFDQSIPTWIDCHVRAFEFFDGVAQRAVLDNLKAGILRAVVHDAAATRSYRERAEHYGFLISPCRPRTPRHKGKVEKGGVHYVKRNALAGREFRDELQANEHLEQWLLTEAGLRDHGTMHWKPLELFHEYERVAVHSRALRPGTRMTDPAHLPPPKVAGLMATPQAVRARAAAIGPATAELVERLLEERPLDRLRTAQGILKLAQRPKIGPARLEAACGRALGYGEVSYWGIRRILDKGLEAQPPEVLDRGAVPRTAVFARPASQILN